MKENLDIPPKSEASKDLREYVVKISNEKVSNIKEGKYDSKEYNDFGLELIRKGYFKQARKIFRALRDKEKEENKGRNLNNLAITYLSSYDTSAALRYFRKAYEYDAKRVGEEEAKKSPAWKNMQIVNSYIQELIKPETTKLKENLKNINKDGIIPKPEIELEKTFYEDFLFGGIVAGCIFYLIQLIFEDIFYLNTMQKFLYSIIIAFISFLIFYFRCRKSKNNP
jgi:tetratricopeptide (TPR) repeat protein